MEKKTVNKNGVGFCGLLTLVFITLKLCNVIDWGWAWVFAPLWISWGITLITIGIIYLVTFLIDRYF